MSDPISAYNARLEAMAAACESAERSNRQTAQEYGGWPEARGAFIRSADHLRAAAAFIRSQMLRPIEEATDGMAVLLRIPAHKPTQHDPMIEPEWIADVWPGDWYGPEQSRPVCFLPLPQIGGE